MRPYLVAFVVVCLFGCNREGILPNTNSTVIDVTSQPNWQNEPIDAKYTIQFPKSYRGGFGPTTEGPEFSLLRKDGNAYSLAPYHIALSGGGVPLPTPAPASILYVKLGLNRTVTFRRNGQTQGVFYYIEQPQARVQLYLLRNGQLQYSLVVQYRFDLHREVLGILQTIHPK